MNEQPPGEDLWRACPQGELQRMVQGIRIWQRRRMLKQLGTATASLFLAGGAGYVAADLWLWSDGSPPGGIACSDVMRLLPAYRARKLKLEMAEKVSAHLENCPRCGPAYEQMADASSAVANVHCCGRHHHQRAHGRTSIG